MRWPRFYAREAATCKTGYEKFVVCMHIYFSIYDAQPEWYDYTREMFSAYSEKNTGSDVNNVFWKYYDKEIPVPALKALREGVADGSIRPDVNIYAVYQCLLNAYTGTTIYENVSFGVSPVDVVQFTGELLVNYIKNEPNTFALYNKN